MLAHVPGTATVLGGATIRFCRDGVCATGSVPVAAATGSVGDMQLTGAPFSVGVRVEDEGDGFTLFELSLGDGVPFADSDVYSITVINSAATTLLKVSRPAQYQVVHACGHTCLAGSMELYPTSASGVVCGNKTCTISGGVVFSGTLATNDTSDPLTVSLCRNGKCGTGTASIAAISASVGTQQQVAIVGDLGGSLTFRSIAATAFSYIGGNSDDNAALANGDVYAFTISQPMRTLVSVTTPIAYVESFPNGAACDGVPCRHAEVRVP